MKYVLALVAMATLMCMSSGVVTAQDEVRPAGLHALHATMPAPMIQLDQSNTPARATVVVALDAVRVGDPIAALVHSTHCVTVESCDIYQPIDRVARVGVMSAPRCNVLSAWRDSKSERTFLSS